MYEPPRYADPGYRMPGGYGVEPPRGPSPVAPGGPPLGGPQPHRKRCLHCTLHCKPTGWRRYWRLACRAVAIGVVTSLVVVGLLGIANPPTTMFMLLSPGPTV